MVMTPHYTGPGHGIKEVLHRIYRQIMRIVLKRVDRFICVGEEERRAFLALFPVAASRCQVIPNGVEDEFLESTTQHERVENEILAVSRLEHFKRIDKTVSAMPYLPDMRLTVIGEGAARTKISKRLR